MESIETVKSCQKLIDSSVLYAIFNLDDRLNARARKLLKKLAKARAILLVHPLVIIEVLSLIKYRVGEDEEKAARKEIYDLSKYCVLEVKMELTSQLIGLFEKLPGVGLIDTMLIKYSLDKKLELVTFDKKQEGVWRKLAKKGDRNGV